VTGTGVRQWTGGASVRLRSFGMLNMSKPFATLSLAPQRIELEVRPAFLSHRLPGYPWTLTPADDLAIFPVRGSAFARGIGFQPGLAKPYYFWCGRAQRDVLNAIEAMGFRVDRQERRPHYR
jgi:hypothetical protein